MLNKSSSSKKTKNEALKRAPFQEVNRGGLSRNSSGRSTSSISSSIDAPTGCLRFFLSNSKTPISQKPKLKSKMTTKSAPNAKTRSTSSRSSKNPSENHPPKPKSKKKDPIVSVVASKAKLLRKSPSVLNEIGVDMCLPNPGSKKLDNAGEVFDHMGGSNVDFTPLGKLGCGSVLDCDNSGKSVAEKGSSSGSAIKTPPVQASVSPELLRGSSVLNSISTMTPSTCYGAGHVISGVSDKRKCRPKGVLTVGAELDSSGCNVEGDNVVRGEDSSGHFIRILTGSRPSLVPLPVEASMSWHLSPCHEEDVGEKGDAVHKLFQKGNSVGLVTPDSPSLSTSPDELATNLCDTGSYNDDLDSDATPRGRLTRITLLSPRRLAEFQVIKASADTAVERLSLSSPSITPDGKVVLSKEERDNENNWAGESTPLSIGSLSSGNVMQTPKSESSSERHVFPSWLDVEDSAQETAIDSLTELLRLQSLSPRSQKSTWDPLGLKFQSTDLSSPCISIDPIQHQKAIEKHASWFSGSTFGDMQNSETRISWREGLVSQVLEMDDLDCCRYMSDEENDAGGSSEYLVKVCHESEGEQNDRLSTSGLRSPVFLDCEPDIGSKGKGKISSSKLNSCAESICTDGGGLVASRDSDWTICYKNQLFDI